MAVRVTAFVDGFNLYHAVDCLGKHHLKWVDLRTLCEQYAPRPRYELTHVLYFSAYATWRPNAYKRHREYLNALRAAGVTPVMGAFKRKERCCTNCGHSWQHHEEKATDVKIALQMVRGGFVDTYDRALLISGDSDLVPAVEMVLREFPMKEIRVVAPVGRAYSTDLLQASGGEKLCRKMKPVHLERALFPREVRHTEGRIVAVRPGEYGPPA
jgi:uncharacterized LabA/DUF88 family protein